ncbi:low density lipoprotein receptor adapter protein 1, partial [Asbolus verrucosus]
QIFFDFAELSEELALQNGKEAESEQIEMIENENDVITFKLKYLGSTVVEKIVGDNINTEAVKNIIKVTKAGRKKLQRVNIAISLKGIVVTDLEGNDIFKISIYRISNCSTDPTHRQVFSFVSTDSNETMECHAFICSKRKMAETVTLAVAHAFSTAYEAWRILPSTKEFEKNAIMFKENEKNNINQNEEEKIVVNDIVEEKLIDFDDEPESEDQSFVFGKPPCQENLTNHWVTMFLIFN